MVCGGFDLFPQSITREAQVSATNLCLTDQSRLASAEITLFQPQNICVRLASLSLFCDWVSENREVYKICVRISPTPEIRPGRIKWKAREERRNHYHNTSACVQILDKIVKEMLTNTLDKGLQWASVGNVVGTLLSCSGMYYLTSYSSFNRHFILINIDLYSFQRYSGKFQQV